MLIIVMGDLYVLIVYAGSFEKKRFFLMVIDKNTAAGDSFYQSGPLSLRVEW